MQLKGDLLVEFDKCLALQVKLTKNIIEAEHNKYLKEFGISSDQGLLLKYVIDFPGSTQTQISSALHKDKTSVTRMIDTLVKKNKIIRKNSTQDRRIFKIYITKETEENAQAISPIFEKRQEELKKLIDDTEYEITLKVLNQIKDYYKGLNK